MNEIAIFENNQFGEIRTAIIDGEPWFVAADVCRALEIKNSRDVVARLDEDEKGVVLIDTLGGKQEMTTVSESGLYSLVLGSRKPEARAFKRWITHEVIPSIRKTGAYGKPMSQLEIVKYSLDKLIEQERQVQAIKEEQAFIRTKINDLEAKLNPTVGMEDWYAIAGYISLKKYRVPSSDYASLGKLASRLSREKGYPIGSAPHPVYGSVNTYSPDILVEVFERYRSFKGEC